MDSVRRAWPLLNRSRPGDYNSIRSDSARSCRGVIIRVVEVKAETGSRDLRLFPPFQIAGRHLAYSDLRKPATGACLKHHPGWYSCAAVTSSPIVPQLERPWTLANPHWSTPPRHHAVSRPHGLLCAHRDLPGQYDRRIDNRQSGKITSYPWASLVVFQPPAIRSSLT